MISVRKQEFLEMFLPGVIYLIIGISGLLLKNNIINLISFLLVTCYSAYKFTKRNMKKQKDDDDSLQNKYKAGYVTLFLEILLLTIYLGVNVFVEIFTGNGLYSTIAIDLNSLCVILGSLEITYYLAFMHFDRTE